MGTVSITKVDKNLKESILTCLKNIGGIESFLKRGDSVLLKPNINGTECVTNTDIVDSLVLLLKEYGITKMAIAESTFGDAAMTDFCFMKTGYVALAKKHQIELINLNKSREIRTKVKHSLILSELRIAEEVFAYDTIINIPVMKVHYATSITLSLKNLKGLLVGDEKCHFHEVGLDKAIVDLNNTIGPTLNLIDCTTCMERMGPRGGDEFKMNLLIAGGNRGEVDYVGAQIMGYSLDEVKHLQTYIECNSIHPGNIQIKGEDLSNGTRPFVKVVMDNNIPGHFEIYNSNACSSCMNAFLLSSQFLDTQHDIKADIFMGKALPCYQETNRLKIAFGNCAQKMPIDFDEKIKGCPPYPFLLKKMFERKLSARGENSE